jgi:hypothetical protein
LITRSGPVAVTGFSEHDAGRRVHHLQDRDADRTYSNENPATSRHQGSLVEGATPDPDDMPEHFLAASHLEAGSYSDGSQGLRIVWQQRSRYSCPGAGLG